MVDYYYCKTCGACIDEFDSQYNDAGVCYLCSCIVNSSRVIPPIKIVQKEWGSEEWLTNSPLYCSKILHIKKGMGTSIHYHKHKMETMRVLSGEFRIMLEGELFILKGQDILNIYPYQVHKIDAISDAQLLEVSTQHFDDDSIRLGRNLMEYLKENKEG